MSQTKITIKAGSKAHAVLMAFFDAKQARMEAFKEAIRTNRVGEWAKTQKLATPVKL